MRKILFLILSFVVSNAVAQQLTVASYNVRYDNDSDRRAGNAWSDRCPNLCAQIDSYGFDLFGAQEVLHPMLLDMLAALPEYDYVGVGREDGKTAGEYAPIFYRKDRFKVEDWGVFWLSEETDHPNRGWDAVLPRICTWAKLEDMSDNRTVWFFNLHLDHVGVKARRESVKLVVNTIDNMCSKDDAVILTGDFNVDQHNEIYPILASSGVVGDSFELAGKRFAPTGTFNAYDPDAWTDSRIDHVFVSPGWKVESYLVPTGRYWKENTEAEQLKSASFPNEVSYKRNQVRLLSDHYPVVVKLSYDGNKH